MLKTDNFANSENYYECNFVKYLVKNCRNWLKLWYIDWDQKDAAAAFFISNS